MTDDAQITHQFLQSRPAYAHKLHRLGAPLLVIKSLAYQAQIPSPHPLTTPTPFPLPSPRLLVDGQLSSCQIRSFFLTFSFPSSLAPYLPLIIPDPLLLLVPCLDLKSLSKLFLAPDGQSISS